MRSRFRNFLLNLSLLLFGAFLFALSHPNFVFHRGLFFFAYFAFTPVFILVHRIKLCWTFLWGGAYGALSYFLFGSWLLFFHPLAIQIVIFQYFIFFLFLFPLLKLADIYFPRYYFIVQCIMFLGYEYIKTLGFMGFSYGIIGYTQWEFPAVIAIASVFGVWGVSALVLVPSALIAAFFNLKYDKKYNCGRFLISQYLFRLYKKIFCIWIGCFFGCVIFGFISKIDYSNYPCERVALIQHNEDPWNGDLDTYRLNFEKLCNLSDAALKAYPNTSLVVWSETAFVPRIEWHYKYRESMKVFSLVTDLLTYINSSSASFLIGNDDAVFEPNTEKGGEGIRERGRIDYNAALLFIPGKNVIPPKPERYRKMHLVPFTETFPYKDTFPSVYNFLIESDTHFWEKGNDLKIFSVGKLKFSVPICFEDTFGYISGNFADKGAEVFINITNDAWAGSVACQYQHLSMAVFRAVETRRPFLRAASSGQTAYIDMNGRVVQMLAPFTENFLSILVPLAEKPIKTIYMKVGDLSGCISACLSCLILIFIFIKYIIICE